MKFIDGNWLVPENLALLHKVHVHQVLVEGNELVAHIAARELRNRADQINAPLFILRLFSPAEGIIGVHAQRDRARRPYRNDRYDHCFAQRRAERRPAASRALPARLPP
jgi:hypothetical protein